MLKLFPGAVKIVEILLLNGADMHLKANSALGERPLHICCKNGGSFYSSAWLLIFVIPNDLSVLIIPLIWLPYRRQSRSCPGVDRFRRAD